MEMHTDAIRAGERVLLHRRSHRHRRHRDRRLLRCCSRPARRSAPPVSSSIFPDSAALRGCAPPASPCTRCSRSDGWAHFVLIAGAWHGAWCWQKIVPLLEAQGHRVLTPDLPGHRRGPVRSGESHARELGAIRRRAIVGRAGTRDPRRAQPRRRRDQPGRGTRIRKRSGGWCTSSAICCPRAAALAETARGRSGVAGAAQHDSRARRRHLQSSRRA